MNIAYFTNIKIKESSGGGSGVNFAIFSFLKKESSTITYSVIKPKFDLLSKIKSIFLKKIGVKRNYHYFSEKRLLKVDKIFKSYKKEDNIDAYFFHGFTQWIKTKPDKPYYCFNDACFATYVEIYNNKSEFSTKDLKRIYKQEAEWLNNAKKVFFRSKWALEETKKKYKIKGLNFENVGVGGFIDIPEKDEYKEGINFLFVSREFIPKGGLVVVEAIKLLRKTNKQVNLWIVGDDPGAKIKAIDGVNYLGFFKKNIKSQKEELVKIFKKAFALIHPTLKDTNTLVISELAYFGCPSISTDKFAIPEYLIDGKSGYLLDNPRDEVELANKMRKMIEDESNYLKMRQFARENAVENNTWQKVGERIFKSIIASK
ncbi:glycosyltransferase family 4 protein [Polaribacter sargassicola]|uniref:glycosyltransferase family 4 protein n=1 Tax=Polaribacter sargassicola TaxID=2836891 RepID=UPI001F2AB4C6|nr:glycosyltransferase [Polaribacter sp. DS7-9]MCG1037813.1 glycosyltransferase [Polaribacter sp. DS7-9]